MKVVNVDNEKETFSLLACKNNAVPSHYEAEGTKTPIKLDGKNVTVLSNTKRTKYIVLKSGEDWLYTSNDKILKAKALKTYVKPEPVKKESKKADKPAEKKAETKKAAPTKAAAKKPATKKPTAKKEATPQPEAVKE